MSAGGGGGGTSTGPTITRADLENRAHMNTYDIVMQLRPAWVRPRGSPSFQTPSGRFAVVYVDQGRLGLPDSLRQIDPAAIDEIRYLNPTDATTRFGTGHMGGAILVTSRTGR